jgi:tRNA C32,U32 (ribose-2'-O)-methylase TrmJ
MSLNLAQAVMVFGYEWWLARQGELPVRELQTNETRPATKGELDNFMVHLIRECDQSGFLNNPQKRPGMVRNLRHFFQRGEVTRQELQTLHGVVSELVRGRKEKR